MIYEFCSATRSGASEGLSYLPVVTKTTQTESGYTTLGEAIRRLDLVEAISDPEKANFVFRVLEMTVQHKLLSLSGSAIRRLFCIISKVGFLEFFQATSRCPDGGKCSRAGTSKPGVP